jgi:hypothetical protein
VNLLAVVRRQLWRMFLSLTAVFMLVVLRGVAYWAWITWEERRIEERVSVAREWPPDEISLLVGVERKPLLKAKVKTRCSEGTLFYILTVDKTDTGEASADRDATSIAKPVGVKPANPKDDFETLIQRISDFHIQLIDSDGFEVSSITVPRNGTRRLLGESGKVEAREANATTTCTKRQYDRVTQVSVGWKEVP